MFKTNNEKIRSLAHDVALSAQSVFQERCTAVYIMGSLARGGFSEIASDIDIGIILEGPLRSEDGDNIDKALSTALERNASVKNNVSIFWGSVDSINEVTDGGHMVPHE